MSSPTFRLDIPGPGQDVAPQVNTVHFSHNDLVNQPTLVVPLSAARHINIDNRLARVIYCLLDTVSQTQALGYYVDPNSQLTLTPSQFIFTGLTIQDLYQSPLSNGQGIVLGPLNGARNDEQLPYRSPAGGSTFLLGGQVIVTTCSAPIGILRNNRPAPSKTNWAQQVTSSGAQNLGVQAASALSSALNNVSAGFFNLVTFINPTASTYVATIYPVGSGLTAGQSFTITVPANTTFTVPIECVEVTAAFGLTGQSVIAYQTVVNHTQSDP